jgi:diguanylate cyclase (GGDEF)-like protein
LEGSLMSWIHVVAASAAGTAIATAAGWISTAAVIRRLREQIVVLSRLAWQDRLTGVLNRAGIEDAYTAAGDRSRFLILVDLNAFKSVNDGHGHPAGDQVLAALGARLAAMAARLDGWAGRLGGDEFALVIPTDSQTVAEAAATEAAAVITLDPLPTGPLQVWPSAGVAYAPAGRAWAAALAHADIALYHAKKGSGVTTYQPGMVYPRPAWPRRQARDTPRTSR